MTDTNPYPFTKFLSSISITGDRQWRCYVSADSSDADKQFAKFVTALGTVIRRCNANDLETRHNKSHYHIVSVKIDEIVKHPSYKTIIQMFNDANVQFYCDRNVFGNEYDAVEIVCDYSHEVSTQFLFIPKTTTHFVICIKRGYHSLPV
jgi:hypothetical protein